MSIHRLLITLALGVGCLSADTVYSIPSGSTDSNGAIGGTVDFYLSACVTIPTPSCTLNVAITDTTPDPKSAGQLISGISFDLTNAGTSLSTIPADIGALSNTITNDTDSTDNSGGKVKSLSGSHLTTDNPTNTKPSNWEFMTAAQAAGGSKGTPGAAGFSLTAITGPVSNLIITGTGPYTNANSSITNHTPILGGTVNFTITDFAGLGLTTDLKDVDFYFGTSSGEGIAALTCTTNCGGAINQPTAVPEPFTMPLAGGALILLGLIRRRSKSSKS